MQSVVAPLSGTDQGAEKTTGTVRGHRLRGAAMRLSTLEETEINDRIPSIFLPEELPTIPR